MKPTLRFIHSADLHLDSPFKGLGGSVPAKIYQQVTESTYQAFERLVSYAVEEQVDFVLLVGDLFDQDGRSLKAQIRLKKGLEHLHKAGIDVFISYGNHDHLGASFYPIDYPPNVTIFHQDSVASVPFYKKNELVAHIHGFSYRSRAVYENKTDQYHVEDPSVYQIGMLHGSVSTNTEHDTYAPFQVEQLAEKGFDYWALGHIHNRQVLKEDPPIVYPGNTQGRHRKESGEKGCVLVELNESTFSLSFLPTHIIMFHEAVLDVSEVETMTELHDKVVEWKERNRKEFARSFLSLRLVGGFSIDPILLEDLKETWNDSEEEEAEWMYIQTIHADHVQTWNREELKQGTHFVSELLHTIDRVNGIDAVLQELFSHKQIRKSLHAFSEEEKQEILNEAEHYLLSSLLQKESAK